MEGLGFRVQGFGFGSPVELLSGHITESRSPQLTHPEKSDNQPDVGVNDAENDQEVNQVMSLWPRFPAVDRLPA